MFEDSDSESSLLAGRVQPVDRVQLALYHLAQGDVGTARQAMTDPYSVPYWKQRSAQRGLRAVLTGKTQEEQLKEKPGIVGTIENIVTDPIFLFGAALLFVKPFGKDAVARFMQESSDYTRTLGIIGRKIAPRSEVLKDSAGRWTKLGKQLLAVKDDVEVRQARLYDIVGSAYSEYERRTGGPPTPEVSVRVQAALEQPWNPASPAYSQWERLRRWTRSNIGFRPIRLTPDEQVLFKGFDQARRQIKREVLDNLTAPSELHEDLVSRGIMDSQGPSRIPVEFYAPRLLYVSQSRMREGVAKAVREGNMEQAAYMANPLAPSRITTHEEYLRGGLADKLVGSLRRREYELVPSPDHLELVEKNLVPGTVDALRKLLGGKYAKRIAPNQIWGEYSLDATRAWPQYLDSMARFQAWTGTGYGKAIREELGQVAKQNKWLANYAANTLVPAVRGKLDPQEFMKAQMWEGRKLGFIRTLQTSPVFQNSAARPVANWLTDALVGGGSLSSRHGIDTAVSAYLYAGALGGNVHSGFANLMQTVATTMPEVGPTAAFKGTWAALKSAGRYASLRLGGMSHDVAYERAFQKYIDAGLHLSADFGDEAFRRMVSQAWTTASARPQLRKALKSGQWLLMSTFRAPEAFNRMVAFESGVSLAKSNGLRGDAATTFAHRVVEETQFLGGPFSKPVEPVFGDALGTAGRMFTQYPSRLAWWLLDALKMKNWGKLGAFMAGSAAAKQIGHSLGLDMSTFSPESGLPTPQDPSLNLFGALPVVPPALSLLGGAAYGIGGDWSYFKRAMPILVPGGVAAARAASVVSPQVAEFLDRKYADYQNPLPDGRIVLRKANGVPVGAYRPTQIVMLGLGLKPWDMAQEQELTRYVQVQGQRTAELRRAYVQSLLANDVSGMQQANEGYRALWGKDILVRESTIKAIRDRRMMLRSQLLLQQLPPDVRPQFGQALGMGLTERLGQFDPDQASVWSAGMQ